MKDMRAEFEAWAEKELLPLDKRDSEHYRYNLTNRAWAGWKAALSAVPAELSSNPLQLPSQAQQTEAVTWTYGANEFKDWCSHWFGVDADESYLSKAIHDLPPMAQNFKRTSQAQQESQWISVEERLPEVKKGDYENVIVCKINPDGKKYVFEASYLNELELQFDESDEYRSFSGWHIQIERDGDDHFEGIQYGIVTHWMVKPLPPAPEGDKP